MAQKKPLMSHALMFARGGDKFKCTVTYNVHADGCVFHDIDVPTSTSEKILERFLEDALRAMYKKLEDQADALTQSVASGFLQQGDD